MIRITSTLIENDNTGQLFVRYTPELVENGACATGRLSFASWDCAVGAPDDMHSEARRNAIDNAKKVLKAIVSTL